MDLKVHHYHDLAGVFFFLVGTDSAQEGEKTESNAS